MGKTSSPQNGGLLGNAPFPPRGGSVSELDTDERATIAMTDSGGRPYKLLIVSEPGLYNLGKGSNKPGAKRFWRRRASRLRATPAAGRGAFRHGGAPTSNG
jgi:hypothetical protein